MQIEQIRTNLSIFTTELATLLVAKGTPTSPLVEAIANSHLRALCRGDERCWREALPDLFGSASNIYRCFPKPNAETTQEVLKMGKAATKQAVEYLGEVMSGNADRRTFRFKEYYALIDDPCGYSTFLRLVEEVAFIFALRHACNLSWNLFRYAFATQPPVRNPLTRFSDAFVGQLQSKLTKEDISEEAFTTLYEQLRGNASAEKPAKKAYPDLITIAEIAAVIRGIKWRTDWTDRKRSWRFTDIETTEVVAEESASTLSSDDLREIQIELKNAQGWLSKQQQEFFLKRFGEKKTYETVAKEMNQKPSTVRGWKEPVCEKVKAYFKTQAPSLYRKVIDWLNGFESQD